MVCLVGVRGVVAIGAMHVGRSVVSVFMVMVMVMLLMPVRMIAAAFMVSEEAIHSRLRSSGISRSISHRKVEVHAQAAQEPRLVVKANDHQA